MSDTELDAAWERVLSEWEDDKAHSAFLSRCQATKRLGEAARRYRSLVEPGSPFRERADRLEAAQKRLDAVTILAVLDMHAHRTEPTQPKGLWALRVIAVAIAMAAVYTFFKLATR